MKSPPDGISEIEIEALLAHVTGGAVGAKTAIALMVLHGVDSVEAARRVFYALGGSDATKLDAEGRARYVGSGKLVVEVEHAIEK